MEGSGRGPNFRYYPGICLEGRRETRITSVRIVDLWSDI
jgi:hypothetical protein